MTTVRAKFLVSSVTKHSYGGGTVKLTAQYDPNIPEDQRFQKATPSGTLEMQIDNPPAFEALELGKYYYLDLTPAA